MKIELDPYAKAAIDGVAAGVTLATLLKWMPAIAAGFTIVWTAIRIWETNTVQKLVAWVRSWLKDSSST